MITETNRNLIRSTKAVATALDSYFAGDWELEEVNDAIDQCNRDLHPEGIDPDIAALATEVIELATLIKD